MVRPTRKKQIQNLQEVIKETSWSQIAREGASACSQISTPAVESAQRFVARLRVITDDSALNRAIRPFGMQKTRSA